MSSYARDDLYINIYIYIYIVSIDFRKWRNWNIGILQNKLKIMWKPSASLCDHNVDFALTALKPFNIKLYGSIDNQVCNHMSSSLCEWSSVVPLGWINQQYWDFESAAGARSRGFNTSLTASSDMRDGSKMQQSLEMTGERCYLMTSWAMMAMAMANNYNCC